MNWSQSGIEDSRETEQHLQRSYGRKMYGHHEGLQEGQ